MKELFEIWFDEEASYVFAYLVAYCLCYLALMYVLDHIGKGKTLPVAGYSSSVLTSNPTFLQDSVVKAKNE